MNKIKRNLFFSIAIALAFSSMLSSYFPKTKLFQLNEWSCPNGHHFIKKIPIAYGLINFSPRLAKWSQSEEIVFGGCTPTNALYKIKCKQCRFEGELNSNGYHVWSIESSDLKTFPKELNNLIRGFPINYGHTLKQIEVPVFSQRYIYTGSKPIQNDIEEKFNGYSAIDWKDTVRKSLPTFLRLYADTQLKKTQKQGSPFISAIYEESISYYTSAPIQELTKMLVEYCKVNKLQQPIENQMDSHYKLISGIQSKFTVTMPTYLYEYEIHKLTDSSHAVYFRCSNNTLKKVIAI